MNIVDFYAQAYRNPGYRMKGNRRLCVSDWLRRFAPGSHLDVGCGRGELLDVVQHSRGCEIVPDLCGDRVDLIETAAKLPYADDLFDVVTCIDVLEHLAETDAMAAVGEIRRVMRNRALLGICTRIGLGHVTVHDGAWWQSRIPGSVRVSAPEHVANFVWLEVGP